MTQQAPRPPAAATLPVRAPVRRGVRVGIYGPGGIGKTTLAAAAPRPLFFDLDKSLGVLGFDTPCAEPATWREIRNMLGLSGWEQYQTLVFDSASVLEELAVAHTLETVLTDKNQRATSIESYGYGKGFQYVYDTFSLLLSDLDKHADAGRNIVFLMHDCTTTVPNPTGEDYLRFEPRLQNPSSGKNSIRLRLREWLDHLLFVGYDIDVQRGTRTARGTGTRTIYPQEQPYAMAKSRKLREPMPFFPGTETEFWKELL